MSLKGERQEGMERGRGGGRKYGKGGMGEEKRIKKERGGETREDGGEEEEASKRTREQRK